MLTKSKMKIVLTVLGGWDRDLEKTKDTACVCRLASIDKQNVIVKPVAKGCHVSSADIVD